MHTWADPMLLSLFIEYIFYSENIFPPELPLTTSVATKARETERKRGIWEERGRSKEKEGQVPALGDGVHLFVSHLGFDAGELARNKLTEKLVYFPFCALWQAISIVLLLCS